MGGRGACPGVRLVGAAGPARASRGVGGSDGRGVEKRGSSTSGAGAGADGPSQGTRGTPPGLL